MKESNMNQPIFKGQWDKIKSQMKQTWGDLTESELNTIQHNQDEIFRILQKHYGYSREEAKKQVDKFKQQLH